MRYVPALVGLHEARGGLDLDCGSAPVAAGPQIEPARPELQDDLLRLAVVVGHVVELPAAVQPEHRAVGELELGSPARVRPDPIAGKEGRVGIGFLGAGLGFPLER